MDLLRQNDLDKVQELARVNWPQWIHFSNYMAWNEFEGDLSWYRHAHMARMILLMTWLEYKMQEGILHTMPWSLFKVNFGPCAIHIVTFGWMLVSSHVENKIRAGAEQIMLHACSGKSKIMWAEIISGPGVNHEACDWVYRDKPDSEERLRFVTEHHQLAGVDSASHKFLKGK